MIKNEPVLSVAKCQGFMEEFLALDRGGLVLDVSRPPSYWIWKLIDHEGRRLRRQVRHLPLQPEHDRTHSTEAERRHDLFEADVQIEVIVDVEDCLAAFPIESCDQQPRVAPNGG